MFDVTPSEDVYITGLDFSMVTGSDTLHVWTRVGTYVGNEQSATGWTEIGTGTAVTSVGPVSQGNPFVHVDFVGPSMSSGQVFGVALILQSGSITLRYTNVRGNKYRSDFCCSFADS